MGTNPRQVSSHWYVSFVQCIVFLVAIYCTLSSAELPTCRQLNSCVCVLDDGRELNISHLGVPGFAKFDYEMGPEKKFFYTYNPCYNFKDDYCKTETIACQDTLTHTLAYSLGTAQTGTWHQDEGYYSIHYKDGAGGRSTVVELKCDETAKEPKLQVLGEKENLQYFFRLVTECACPGKCGTASAAAAGGISAGSVMCIIFSVLLVVYVVGGILFMKFVRGAEGKELVPNVGFWSSLPGYIKDGVMFVVTCGRNSSYEEVH